LARRVLEQIPNMRADRVIKCEGSKGAKELLPEHRAAK
jgi:hypothetical protein